MLRMGITWGDRLLLLLSSFNVAAIRIDPDDVVLPTSPRRLWPWSASSSKTPHVSIPTSPDEHLVSSLPLLHPNTFKTKHWAGHLPASADSDKYLFYWLFEPDITDSDKKEADAELLIWLNGGPGCSSMDGLFMENGPFRFSLDTTANEYKLIPDEHSWHKLPAWTLYIDQPVGTGLSFTRNKNYASNDQELSQDFYYFLQQFLKLHDDKFVQEHADGLKAMNRKLLFSGESYSGHYLPVFTNYILKQNEDLKEGNVQIPIKGAAIGNGFFWPYHQYGVADFAYGRGLIGLSEVAALKETEIQCQRYLDSGLFNVKICFHMIKDVVKHGHGKDSDTKLSKYDIRRIESKDGDRVFPPNHDVVEAYLGNWPLKSDGTLPAPITKDALKALHAEASSLAGHRFEECSDPPHSALRHMEGKSSVNDIVEVLEHPAKVELLFFNGVFDVICNHVGNEKALDLLAWKEQASWIQAQRYVWNAKSDPTDTVSGYMREHANLKFLKVRDSGHMVPFDVPGVAFDMMQTFVYGDSFKTHLQDLSKAKPNQCSACPSCNITAPDIRSQRSSGVFHLWIVAGVALVTVLTLALWKRRDRNSESASSFSYNYGFEMKTPQYRD